MNYRAILEKASNHLHNMNDYVMDVVDISKPTNLEYAQLLAKVVSKLSPLVGNMIEHNLCIELNKLNWQGEGKWVRQDPGFPDTIFESELDPLPGIEIKTWFPLATEITARFKDSVNFFDQDQTNVAVVAWLPEYIIYGKPKIIDIWVGSAKSLAAARDEHYHRPPDYLVFEPEDTSGRTSNLQQTNTNGYKFQGNSTEFAEAEKYIRGWGKNYNVYDPNPKYQSQIKELLGKYTYRLDTNFAKIDRVGHEGLESFKSDIMNRVILDHDLKSWTKIIGDKEGDVVSLIQDLI